MGVYRIIEKAKFYAIFIYEQFINQYLRLIILMLPLFNV